MVLPCYLLQDEKNRGMNTYKHRRAYRDVLFMDEVIADAPGRCGQQRSTFSVKGCDPG